MNWNVWRNAILGGVEGLLTANLSNELLGVGDLGGSNRVLGRYLTSALSQAGTSVPGFGYTAYSIYATAATGYNAFPNLGLFKSAIYAGTVNAGLTLFPHEAHKIGTGPFKSYPYYKEWLRPYGIWDVLDLIR